MFQLIIGIIAIALFAAIAAASIFYGGDAFTEGTAKADATTLTNGGQQITGAWTLYRANNGNSNPTVGALATTNQLFTTGYMSALPAKPSTVPSANAWTLVAGDGTAANPARVTLDLGGANDSICLAVQKAAGDAAALSATPSIETTMDTTQSYGCFGATTAGSAKTFYFKR